MRVTLPASPLAPEVSRVEIRYREFGAGAPLVILHGGWGYDVYPFDRQIAALAAQHRIVVPDRTGYGESGSLDVQHPDFHERASGETLAVMDALGIDRAVVWGHSDGAVIALRMALAAPDRVRCVIAEATHFFRRKPASRAFFETMRDAPDQLGERVAGTLQQDHGDRWRALLRTNGAAWLRIADDAPSPDADLYDGRLGGLRAPALLIHGAKDPRTEPGEIDALMGALDGTVKELRMFAEGGHSPHSERATADAVTAAAAEFVARCFPFPLAEHSGESRRGSPSKS